MTRVLILGANGQLARMATKAFLDRTDAQLTLYLRASLRLGNPDPGRVRIAEGDVLDGEGLRAAMQWQDVGFASLAGDLVEQAHAIVNAMHTMHLKRLICVSSMGIYNEVPGKIFGSELGPYRESASVIESSDLDYTILRPSWFTKDEAVDYHITQKGEPFLGSDVSLSSLADLAITLSLSPTMELRKSLGVSRT